MISIKQFSKFQFSLPVAIIFSFVLCNKVFAEGNNDLPIPPPEFPKQLKRINLGQYFKNERATRLQLKCIIYYGPCDFVGKHLKRLIPLYIKTKCKGCSDLDKEFASNLLQFLQVKYPNEWKDALKRFGKVNPTTSEENEFQTELGFNPYSVREEYYTFDIFKRVGDTQKKYSDNGAIDQAFNCFLFNKC